MQAEKQAKQCSLQEGQTGNLAGKTGQTIETRLPGQKQPTNWTKIRLIEGNAKCDHLKKWDLERDFVAAIYLSEAPSPPRFLSGGWSSNFVGSEFGQIHS
jgi:hypothetical protein